MAAKIGIKLADGTFFPIMNEDFSASETLELTTVRDDQRSVQINLFKKEEEDLSDPEYIGSLIVEDIDAKAAGEPTIELHLSLDEEKNLSAEATDKDSGSYQTLRVSLETFSDQSFKDIDFDFNTEPDEIDFSSSNDFDSMNGKDDSYSNDDFSTSVFYSDDDDKDETEKKRTVPLWLLILLILLGIGALILSILLLTKKKETTEVKTVAVHEEIARTMPTETKEDEENVEPMEKEKPNLPPDTSMTEPPKPAKDIPAEQENQTQENMGMQQSAIKEPAASAALQRTVRYKIRWGDTLWDLSETYYRNPWLYTEIAKHNKLKNPDLIISGTYIEIPPQ